MKSQAADLSLKLRLRRILGSITVVQMIYVAAKLGLADLLQEGAKDVDALAEATNTHAPSLYRVLRGLASQGIFTEVEPRRFSSTPLAALLRAEAADSMRNDVLWLGEPWVWRPTGELLHSVKTGETAFDCIFGLGFFDYCAQNPEADKIFNQRMQTITSVLGPEVAKAYDFGATKKAKQGNVIIDIGGSHGTLMVEILSAHPSTQGVIFDLPEVVEGARETLQAFGVTTRCQLVGGSFFESLPSGGDIYILKDILHDWDEETIQTILQNCHQAMSKAARLLIIERVIPTDNRLHEGKIVDVDMLTLTGGRERTQAEFDDLLRLSRFTLTSVTPTSLGIDILEARPV